MKIAYSHLVRHINDGPSIDELSNKLFQLGHEHEIENKIFDMEFTPNRGDCLSINGILRDLSVFYTINLDQDIYDEQISDLSINFENLSKEICPKISFLKIEVDKLPSLYKGALEEYFCDLSLSKNNFFTDVSNYLSYETGQPTHCYDSDSIKGKLTFQEHNGNKEFESLLGKKINLTEKNSVFLLNNEVINLAGIMGGLSTACSSDTTSVIIECAFFRPESVVGKSIKYGINSEAAHKFERGVDPECHERVLRRFVKIISEHANIINLELISHKYEESQLHQILIDVNKINKIIGININIDEYIEYLLRLGFLVKGNYIEVPSFRSDIKTQNDLAEEVARVIGYDNIPRSEIKIPVNVSKRNNIENKIRYFLLDHGFYEVINSPFVNVSSEYSIKVDNPLDSNRRFLRTNIINSLVDNLLFNERRQKDSVKLFEISDVYSAEGNLQKSRKLSIIASGRVGLNYQEFSTKISIKYLSTIFAEILPNITFDFKTISRDKLDTKLKSEIIYLEIDVEMLSDDVLHYVELSKPAKEFIQYKPISELPSSYKDISYSIRNYNKVDDLQNLIFNFKHEILKDIFIFDYFKNDKKNEIKIGFRFIFQSKDETLTSSQIDKVLNDIVSMSLKISEIEIPGLNHN
jgi:phenylalanyl-tRNA synthetase beta chain